MNCDRIARWYRLFEHLAFGGALQRRRVEYLGQAATAKRILILGDGDGRFTAALVERNPRAEIDSVDVSGGMLKLARRRLRDLKLDSATVRFWECDARTVALEGKYDLVVTHFFLDCFTTADLRSLVACISLHCASGTKWLVSEFNVPEEGLRREAARMLIRFMYFFFRIATGLRVSRLPEYRKVMAQNGFCVAQSRADLGGLLVSELWDYYGSK
jgi:ubiquinone/menaquinone biosynthesis C-methylase UbiE